MTQLRLTSALCNENQRIVTSGAELGGSRGAPGHIHSINKGFTKKTHEKPPVWNSWGHGAHHLATIQPPASIEGITSVDRPRSTRRWPLRLVPQESSEAVHLNQVHGWSHICQYYVSFFHEGNHEVFFFLCNMFIERNKVF